jgi:hypothetical protein
MQFLVHFCRSSNGVLVESVNYANTYLLSDEVQDFIEYRVILFQNTVKDKQSFIRTTNTNLQKCQELTVTFLAYRLCANWKQLDKVIISISFSYVVSNV